MSKPENLYINRIVFLRDAFPVIISALQEYQRGLPMSLTLFQNNAKLNKLYRNLQTSFIHYGQAVELLLADIIPAEQKDRARKSISYTRKQKDDRLPLEKALEEALERKIGDSYHLALDAIHRIQDNLDKLATDIVVANPPQELSLNDFSDVWTPSFPLYVNPEFHTIIFKMSEDKMETIADKLLESVTELERIVDTAEKLKPFSTLLREVGFKENAKMASWTLMTTETEISPETKVPNLRSHNKYQPLGVRDLDRVLESCFGVHKRTPVAADHFAPGGKYRAVCKLLMHFEGQPKDSFMIGSGWLINPSTVVTAGHCVYDWGHSTRSSMGHATKIQVYVGYNGEDKSNLEVRDGQHVAVHWGWYKEKGGRHDLAFIRLTHQFGKVTPLNWTDTPSKGLAELRIVGYPGDIPHGAEGEYMYESGGLVYYDLAESDLVLNYNLDTAGGNSGGPVLQIGVDEQITAIGTHCSGGTINHASVIGHVGNNFHAFLEGLSIQDGSETAREHHTIEVLTGGILDLKSITIPQIYNNPTSMTKKEAKKQRR